MSTWPEPIPGCLSGFRVSKAALDELDAAERAQVTTHLARCERCAGRVASERIKVAAAAHEAVPDALREAPAARVVPMRKPTRSWVGVAGAFALAAAVMLVAIPRPEGGMLRERAKGQAAVEVAVQRNGVLLGEPTSAIDTPRLEVGDRLRLKLQRDRGIYADVKALDGGAWVEVFRGVIPEDGWLPMGLVVTEGDPPSLSVRVCHDTEFLESDGLLGCILHTLNLRMR